MDTVRGSRWCWSLYHIVPPPLAVVRSRTGVYSVPSGGDNVAMVSVLGCVFLHHDHPFGLGQPG